MYVKFCMRVCTADEMFYLEKSDWLRLLRTIRHV